VTPVIVEADSAQAPFIIDTRRWLAEEVGSAFKRSDSVERLEAELMARRYRAWVSIPSQGRGYDDSMAGVLGVEITARSDGVREARVIDLFVEREFRGRGLARQLLRHFAQLPELSPTRIASVVVDARCPLARLFEEAGWVRADEWLELRR
jgi:GNAT superfamily N-acetyltransferase